MGVTVPKFCVLYLLIVYLLLCYFLFGPLYSRWYWRKYKNVWAADQDALHLWIMSPFSVPIFVIYSTLVWLAVNGHQFFCWLVYGRDE
jgi:hypothetical protein